MVWGGLGRFRVAGFRVGGAQDPKPPARVQGV